MLGTAVSAWQAVRATQAEAVAVANEQQAHANAAHANQQRDEARALAEKLQAALELLRRTTYSAQMNLAQHAWEAGAISLVLELLEQQRPKPGETDLRHFEWHYLYRLSHMEILTLNNAGGFSVAYSPDGKRLASASWDKTVKVWDAQTGKELFTMKGGSGSVTFSPNGHRLASGAMIWDATPLPEKP